MSIILDNLNMSTIPKFVYRLYIIVFCVLGGGGGLFMSIVISTIYNESYIIAITFGFTASILLSFFLLWIMLASTITPRWVHLENDTFVLEKTNGKKFTYKYSDIIGFTDTQIKDENTGEPLWIVAFIGRSMFSAHQVTLTYENGGILKKHLDEIGIIYKINP